MIILNVFLGVKSLLFKIPLHFRSPYGYFMIGMLSRYVEIVPLTEATSFSLSHRQYLSTLCSAHWLSGIAYCFDMT